MCASSWRGLGCADPAIIREVAGYFQAYDDARANFYTPDPARDLLVQARAAGVRLVALSSNLLALQRIAYCKIDGIFDAVLTPNHGRPKAGLFELLLEQISVSPSECLHIGDDPVLDVLAPRGVGINAVLFDPKDRYADFALPGRVRSYTEMFEWLFVDHNPQPAAGSSA
ncbi:MAG: HAD-IA family hydrolase [Anaerolineales bacterium]|nr:HAD-IA family hydrolase [Anaerolineales bacterium]